MLSARSEHTRPIPGLGNVALSLVSAAATAMASRRVLLLENFSAAGGSFGLPLQELLVETSGWAPHLAAASHADHGEGSALDGFASHDDFSAFEILCSGDLRRAPAARVWRIFSNQYFLPLLLLNPHHATQLEAFAEPLGRTPPSSQGGGAYRSLWTPGLRALWTPAPRLAARLSEFMQTTRLESAPYVAMHVRVNYAEQRDGRRQLKSAIACARARLAANHASRLFLATMYSSNRRMISRELGAVNVSVHWYGRSMEAQAESTAATDSALADMLLMGKAKEVLVTPGSTFGYVAQGLAGQRATVYGGTHTSRDLVGPAGRDCSDVGTGEPNFHFLRHAMKRYSVCRAGAQEATARHSDMFRLSSMLHR
jgi:hypothetical protein